MDIIMELIQIAPISPALICVCGMCGWEGGWVGDSLCDLITDVDGCSHHQDTKVFHHRRGVFCATFVVISSLSCSLLSLTPGNN